MISEEQARRLLRDEAASYDVAPLPGEALVRQAKATVKHRRLVTVVSVAAASAALIVGGVVVVGDDEPGRDAAPAVTAPVASPGHRLVGVGRLAVEVPDSWGTNDVGCDGVTAVADTVVFRGSVLASRLCMVDDREFSTLEISSTTSEWVEPWLPDAVPAGEVGGLPVNRVEVHKVAPGLWSGAVVAPTYDAALRVTSKDRAVVDGVLASATLLPEGFTAVPGQGQGTATLIDEIEAAGLVPAVVEEPRAGFSAGVFLRSDPVLGSVVAEGAEVTVVVTGKPDEDAWPGRFEESPGSAIECVSIYPDALASNVNAFDATITDVVDQPGETAGDGDFRVLLTLRTNEVFTGDAGASVTMQTWNFMLPSDRQSIVGTRVLAASGPSLEVKACGYTRTYDAGTADQWRSRFRVANENATGVTAQDRALVDAVTAFATSPSVATLAEVPLATELHLGLGGEVRKTVSNANLADPATWEIPGPWRAYSGPFSALPLLRDKGAIGLSIGAHGQCGPGRALGSAQPTSPQWEGLRQISIQKIPLEVTDFGCTGWWSVDLFVDGQGVIHGVSVDLWEP